MNNRTYAELEQTITALGEPKFKAEQLFRWFARGVTNPSEMTDLSKAFRDKIRVSGLNIYKKFQSNIDETVKYLIQLDDGSIIESVAMHYKHGISVCISTQVGCRMGCKFCASTLGGKARDLTAGEILGQTALLQRDIGSRISNIVLMGIGEPLDNYDNVVTFLKNVNHEKGMNVGYRHISLSTCGLIPQIDRLAAEDMPITLSVSLHAADDETRSRIMPINGKYPIQPLIAACKQYIKQTGRRISFEYILIDGVNDGREHAEQLSRLLIGMLCHVNLIPANFVPESGLNQSSAARVAAFQQELTRRRVNATVRRELGRDISASCGQLRRANGVSV
jgi:23S rRNA (adenine2503-C2)-methyltransferase